MEPYGSSQRFHREALEFNFTELISIWKLWNYIFRPPKQGPRFYFQFISEAQPTKTKNPTLLTQGGKGHLNCFRQFIRFDQTNLDSFSSHVFDSFLFFGDLGWDWVGWGEWGFRSARRRKRSKHLLLPEENCFSERRRSSSSRSN